MPFTGNNFTRVHDFTGDRDLGAPHSTISAATSFEKLVAEGLMPRPGRPPGLRVLRWSRLRVEAAFDALEEAAADAADDDWNVAA